MVVKYADAPTIVDMGLSVKWASFNVGASCPEEAGYYFAWGEIKPKEYYSWDSYKWHGDESIYSLTKYCINPTYGFNGFTDQITVLEPEDDAANSWYGGKWRIPRDFEIEELCSNTSITSARVNNVDGYWLTSTINGNRLFFPLTGYWEYDRIHGDCGYYWSSSLYPEYNWDASCLTLYDPYIYLDYFGRESGLPIRAVYGDPAPRGNEDITPGGDINM